MTNPELAHYYLDHHTGSLFMNAHSIGLSAADRIQTGIIGKIHSIFQRVINITVLENHLISLVGEEIGHGSLNILVNFPTHINLTTMGIKVGDVVIRVGESIVVGPIVISTERTKIWKPRKNFKGNLQPIETIMSSLEVLRNVALASDYLSGLGELIAFTCINGLKVSKTENLGSVAHVVLPHILELLKAIKSGHSHNIIRITRHLIGLGPGLTPAADDTLLGLMISMFYISENFTEIRIDAKKINIDIVSPISGQTTIISEEFLREASIGNVNEPIALLMENLLTSEKNIESSVRNVLSLGGTSGADTVFGIILGSYLMLSSDVFVREDFKNF